MTGRQRLGPAVALLMVAVAGAGCDYLRDTPEQDLARRRWLQCADGLRDVGLERVDLDGRIRFTYVALNERERVLRCLEVAGREGVRLPEVIPSLAAGK